MKLATLTRLPSADNSAMRATEAQDQSLDPSVGERRRRRLIIGGGVAAVIVVLLTAWLIHRWMDSAAMVSRERVRVAVVTEGRFIRDVSAQGTIVAAVSPTRYAPSAGTVTVIAKPGATVSKGELLATIERPELHNEYQRERATRILCSHWSMAASRRFITCRSGSSCSNRAASTAAPETAYA